MGSNISILNGLGPNVGFIRQRSQGREVIIKFIIKI